MGRELIMVNSEFPTDLLDRLIFAIDGRRSQLFVTEKPMTSDKAIEFLGVSPRTFYKLVSQGSIRKHFFEGLSTPFYFPSEIIETLKKSK